MKDNTLLFGALGVAAYLLYSMTKTAPAPAAPAAVANLLHGHLPADDLPAEHAAPMDFMNMDPFLRAGQSKGVYF